MPMLAAIRDASMSPAPISSSKNEESSSSPSRPLESERYEVTVARDGDTASKPARKPFDCIVLDVPPRKRLHVCRDSERGVQTPSSCSPPEAAHRPCLA